MYLHRSAVSRLTKRLLLAIWIAACSIGAPAYANNTVTAYSGKPQILMDDSKDQFTDIQVTKGNAASVESNTSKGVFSLLYIPPVVSTTASDDVKYKAGGTANDIQISVSPGDPPTLNSPDIYPQAFRSVFILFVLSVLLESALAIIFSWRPVMQFFVLSGIKPVISFAVAYFFVDEFHLDVTSDLVNTYLNTQIASGWQGEVITALVIAGGSSGVNNLMVRLGFRSAASQEPTPPPKPPPTEAWISVTLKRVKAVGPVDVLMTQSGAAPQAIGTIQGTAIQSRLVTDFWRDSGRFPSSGGHTVAPGQTVSFSLAGADKDNVKIVPGKSWGPYSLAPGAVIDIQLSL